MSDVRVGKVEKLVSGGDGLVRQDRLVVFVPGTLAGETIRYTAGPVRKGFARGSLVEVLTASPDRRKPPCPLYGRCGGCDFMHLNEEAQQRAKASLVQEAFRRLAKHEIPLPPVVAGPAWGYRSRLQLHKDAAGSPVGFHARSSSATVPVDQCPVADAAFGPLLASGGPDLPVGRTNAFAAGGRVHRADRDLRVAVTVAGKTLQSSLDGFFQSNLALLSDLVSEVLRALPVQGQRVLDLYGGAGLFGAFLADRYASVVVVEENAAALALARLNVVGPIHEFHASTLEAWVKRQRGAPLDAIVVDPPRTGLSPEVRAFLATGPAPVLAYVSCNPDTLARDARDLLSAGWRLDRVTVFDFYPQTTHIETVARFVRP